MDHIFVLKCIVDLFIWKKKKLFGLLVDCSKTFDMVWRAGLWHKLIRYWVKGKFFKLIKNMYNNNKSCVTVNYEVSDFFCVPKE